MMDAKSNSAVKDGKTDDECANKSMFHDSITTASESPILPGDSTAGQSGSQVSSFQGSTEDTDLSLGAFINTTLGTINLPRNPKGKVSRAASIMTDQPLPLCALLSPSMEACTAYEVSQPLTSINRSQKSFKTTAVHIKPPDRDDLCAPILLACLFCHPLDCLLATASGCNTCIWWLCSSLCGCDSATLQPLQYLARHCHFCGSLGVRCFLCDPCDGCLQATECLDLAMEMSQMLYH